MKHKRNIFWKLNVNARSYNGSYNRKRLARAWLSHAMFSQQVQGSRFNLQDFNKLKDESIYEWWLVLSFNINLNVNLSFKTKDLRLTFKLIKPSYMSGLECYTRMEVEGQLSGAHSLLLLWALGMELRSSGLMPVTFITKLFWLSKYPFWNKYIPTISSVYLHISAKVW